MWWKQLDKTTGENPLWDKWKRAKSGKQKMDVLIRLMNEYPKSIDYLWNRGETCFGVHNVYLVHIQYKGIDYLKIGYTKNTIEQRFGESRYEGSKDMRLIRIVRSEKLQALGAVEFEHKIKTEFESIKTEMVLPGKGELFEMNKENQLVKYWDANIKHYEKIIGIKSPN